MELIDISQAITDLEALGADDTSVELVLNNIKLYNTLVSDYLLLGKTHNLYLIYQLNVQVTKQIMELKKEHARRQPKKSDDGQEEDGLHSLIRQLRQEGETVKPKRK